MRPASRSDIGVFYEWRIDGDDMHLWTLRRTIPSPEEFSYEFEQAYLSNLTLVVARRRDGQEIGFVQASNLNLEQGWTFILTSIAKEYRLAGVGLEATVLLAQYLFSSFPIRKLYADVFGFNTKSLGLLRKFGFQEEGRSREHIWYLDRYWDLIRLAFYRNQWEMASPTLARLRRMYCEQGAARRPAKIARASHAQELICAGGNGRLPQAS